jgi:hypothetical protein
MTTFIDAVLRALKRAAKMEGRIVDEFDVDIRRLVMITILVSSLIRCDPQES